jgi:tRNA/rRNA methyltransferase
MMLEIGYLNPDLPMKLMPRMQQIFNRAQLRDEEINILRGIARAAQKHHQ